jgi:hypothetical protein
MNEMPALVGELVEELMESLRTKNFEHGPTPGLPKNLALCTCDVCFPEEQPRERRVVRRRPSAKIISMDEFRARKAARGQQ